MTRAPLLSIAGLLQLRMSASLGNLTFETCPIKDTYCSAWWPWHMLRLDTWLDSPGKSRVCTCVAFHTMLNGWLVASLDQDMAALKDTHW